MKKQTRPRRPRKLVVSRKCLFCEEKKTPWFSETEVLQRFMTERGKIIARVRSGVCAKHQRRLTASIKHARHLALLPFVVRS
jgi:small subunit ribosomal protein S18